MKICGQEMQVTLPIHGRERTFSEQELIAILEKHFPDEASKQVTTAKVAQVPTEDKWFEVNPLAIDQSIFQKERKDVRQEATRELILEAFAEVKSSPEKYGKKFKTMFPKYISGIRTVAELKKWACELGDHNADWVEQALEWAQRIYNGESWEELCNKGDVARYNRLVVWKSGNALPIGGATAYPTNFPATYTKRIEYDSNNNIVVTVPLVVLYEK